MRTLILATTKTPWDATADIQSLQRPRIDYLDLQEKLSADLIDFSCYSDTPYRWLEIPDRRLRLAWGQALYALRHWGNYDVILSMGEDVGLALAFLLRQRGLRPFQIVVAHNILTSRKKMIVRALGVVSDFDCIIAHTSVATDSITNEFHLDQEQVKFFPTTTTDEQFWEPQTEIEVNPNLIMAVGRAKRDYRTLLAAAEIPPLQLCVQGWSQWPIAYANKAPSKSVNTKVTFGDFLSFIELRDLYARSAFIVLSLTPDATQAAGATAILEAGAMGKAIVVAADHDLSDYLTHEETGLQVPAGDVESLRGAILRLHRNPSEARRLGKNGRSKIQSIGYDTLIDRFSNLIHSVYETSRSSLQKA